MISILIPFKDIFVFLFVTGDDDDDTDHGGETVMSLGRQAPESPEPAAVVAAGPGPKTTPEHRDRVPVGSAANVRLMGTGGGTARSQSAETPPRRSARIREVDMRAAAAEARNVPVALPASQKVRRARTVTVKTPQEVAKSEEEDIRRQLIEYGVGVVHYEPLEPPLRSWQLPSTSTQRPTHVLTRAEISRVTKAPVTRAQQLFAARIEGNLETRVKFPPLTRAELQPLAEETMLGARGTSRWKDVESRWKQFIAWSATIVEGEEMAIAMEWLICMFLEMKMRSEPPNRLAPVSALKYGGDLMMCAARTGNDFDGPTIKEYLAAVGRKGIKPANQAIAAKYEQVVQALRQLTESEAVGMMLAWITASRIGEMAHLLRENFRREGSPDEHLWVVEFPYHKGDPFKLGTVNTVYLGAWAARIEKHLGSLRPGQKVTTLTTERAAAVLEYVDPALSAHSIKRGALVALLRAGVPLSVIQAYAKHKDIETLYIYLPRAEVALHMGMHDASRALCPA